MFSGAGFLGSDFCDAEGLILWPDSASGPFEVWFSSTPVPIIGTLLFGSAGSSLLTELVTCWGEAVNPCDTLSFSSGTVKGLSDFKDLLLQIWGFEGDWLDIAVGDVTDVFNVCSELWRDADLVLSLLGGEGGRSSCWLGG